MQSGDDELSQISVSIFGDNDDQEVALKHSASDKYSRKSIEDYGDIESASPGKKNGSGAVDDDEYEDDGRNPNGHAQVDNLYTDLSCCCLPSCAKRPSEIFSRTSVWFLANSDQFLSSIIVSLSMIPEAISYAVMAGVPPSSALQSCWIVNMITAAVGGRPGMISSASGLTALLLHRLVQSKEGGVMYVFYTVVFAGVLQCLAAFVGLGKLASGFPSPVVVGMVNAMALLLLALQFRFAKEFPLTSEEQEEMLGWDDGRDKAVELSWNASVVEYFGRGFDWIGPGMNLGIYGAEVAVAFLIAVWLPRVTTFFPATALSILAVVAVEFGIARQFGVETPLIGDYGGSQVNNPIETIFTSDRYDLPDLTDFQTWKLVLGYGFALFATSFTETSIALNVVDRLDETQGPGFLVLIGQGLANIVSGLLGGMGGSGVVGLSVLSDRTFGTTCLSTFVTGLITFLIVTWGYPIVDFIPLSAVSGISISMVCSFIQWRSLVAIFTTCLPSQKRDTLPPQYNVARYDVLIMFIVTAGLLLVDVSTMAFFVMGFAVFLFDMCQRRRLSSKNLVDDDVDKEQVQATATRDGEKDKEDEKKTKKKFFEWRGKKKNDKQLENSSADEKQKEGNQPAEEPLPEVMSDPSRPMKSEHGVIEVGDSADETSECMDGLCGMMETAEMQLFPKYEDDNDDGDVETKSRSSKSKMTLRSATKSSRSKISKQKSKRGQKRM
mmetsp:Transcript_27743/g.58297  ORF Transcript_27743/g.58297 Transcript_27743/m.58297 type:complete len:722 (-) Transcript_27743:294-2459(-)